MIDVKFYDAVLIAHDQMLQQVGKTKHIIGGPVNKQYSFNLNPYKELKLYSGNLKSKQCRNYW